MWPGNQTVQPKGLKISTHLKVVTLEELPFIYAEPVHSPDDCNIKFNKVPCPKPNKTGKINLCLKPLVKIETLQYNEVCANQLNVTNARGYLYVLRVTLLYL